MRTTKTKLILEHLKRFKGITSMDAFALYGATRLSAIIFELRKKGYAIYNEDIHKKDRYGNHIHYVRYRLEENKKPWWGNIMFFR